MHFKTALDKYLTEPWDDGYTNWTENVLEALPESVYVANEDWFEEYNECDKLLYKLHRKGYDVQKASAILSRVVTIFVQGK